jgi:hypothetical protein
MNRRVSFHAMAEQELNDAASYYNRQYQGLSCTISPGELTEEGGVYAKL